MNFSRGDVVYHKIMGKGVVLNELNDGKIEVRMANGQPENFYPEELESEKEVQAREMQKTEETVKANEEKAKKWRF